MKIQWTKEHQERFRELVSINASEKLTLTEKKELELLQDRRRLANPMTEEVLAAQEKQSMETFKVMAQLTETIENQMFIK